MTGHAAHQGKLASGIVLDAPEFLPVIRPGQHVAVAAYGKQSLGMGFVQKHFRPFMVDGIAPAVPGQGQHVARGLFHLLQDFLGIVNEHILGIDVVARKQQSDRSGERKHAVTAVGGQTLITSVRSHTCGQILRIGKDMQAEAFVTDPHPLGIEADILQYGRSVFHFQGQVLFEQPGRVFRTYQFFRPQPLHPDMAGIVHDTFELFHGFEELHHSIPVRDFLGEDVSPAQGTEVAPAAGPFTRGLGQVQETAVPQIRAFVEMAGIALGQETFRNISLRTVAFPGEPVLLVHDRKGGKLYTLPISYGKGFSLMDGIGKHHWQLHSFKLYSNGIFRSEYEKRRM